MRRPRYINPRLASLKAKADEYGVKYRDAMWSCAKAKVSFIVLQCFRRTVSRSPLTEDEIKAHRVEIESYKLRVAELRESLAQARRAFADLKRELSADGIRGA